MIAQADFSDVRKSEPIALPTEPLDCFSGLLWGHKGGSFMPKESVDKDSPEYRKQNAARDFKAYLPKFVKLIKAEKGIYSPNTALKTYKLTYCYHRIGMLFDLATELGWLEQIMPSDPRFPAKRASSMRYYKTLRVPTAQEVAAAGE